jgi:transposase
VWSNFVNVPENANRPRKPACIASRLDRRGGFAGLKLATRLGDTLGQAHDLPGAEPLLANLGQNTIIITDKAYDADRLRALITARGTTANIPNMIRRKKRFRWTKVLYRERNHVERFFNNSSSSAAST